MTPQAARTVSQISALAAVLLFTGGCASYWVRYDKEQTFFQEGGARFDKAGKELLVGRTLCSGELDVVREHGLFWWPGGFYRDEDDYAIYFKKSVASSRDFYFTMSHYDESPRTVEARGEVVVVDHTASIDIEYQDAKGKWRKPPINGVHKIDWVLPDDKAGHAKASAEAVRK
jgi:hypothetical protein